MKYKLIIFLIILIPSFLFGDTNLNIPSKTKGKILISVKSKLKPLSDVKITFISSSNQKYIFYTDSNGILNLLDIGKGLPSGDYSAEFQKEGYKKKVISFKLFEKGIFKKTILLNNTNAD